MTERLTDAQLDREIRSFLDRASKDVVGAPSADDMAMRIAGHVRPGFRARLPRLVPQTGLAWLLLMAVLASLLATTVFIVGSPSRVPVLPDPGPVAPISARNGWIAISSQPGYRQTFQTDWATGSDIYLVREGTEPRIIVERGQDKKRNVCPTFSPDGSMLAYGELAGTTASLVVVDVADTGAVTESRRISIAGQSSQAPCPRWTRDGTHLAYLDGVRWDGQGNRVSPGTGVAVFSLEGASVAATADDPSLDDLRRSAVFDPTDSPTDPLLSPDGLRRATCLLNIGFVIGPADGSSYERLLASTACNYSLAAWSPDGTEILLLSDGGRSASLNLVPATGGPRGGARAGGDYIGSVPVNGARSFPGRGDVSWQSIHP